VTDESQTYTVTFWDEGGDQAGEFSLSRRGDWKVHFESRALASTRGPDTGPRLVAEDDISHLFAALGAEPSAPVREALSWRLMAELARRHPNQLRVIEAHGGGGQYDELRLYPRPTPPNVARQRQGALSDVVPPAT
jgi:hypothetical protein